VDEVQAAALAAEMGILTMGSADEIAETHMADQGDVKAYTKDSRTKRQKLRQDPPVVAALAKWWNLVVKDLTHRTDEGMFVSKFEYFRVIYLVCKTVYPGRGVIENKHSRHVESTPPPLRVCMRILYEHSP